MDLEIDFDKISDNYQKYKHVKSNLMVKPENIYSNGYKYSITIPTFKRPYLLLETIESCIKQSYIKDNWQIVIVDNDPEVNTETETIIKNLKPIPNLFYYKNEQNIGLYGNWNRCIDLAQGEYMIILSDDDLLKENFLIEMDRLINKKPVINMIYFCYDYFGSNYKGKSNNIYSNIKDKLLRNRIRKLTLLDYFLRTFGFSASGLFFKKALAIKIGGHDDSLYPSADYYFQSKYANYYGNVFLLNKVLSSYRAGVNETMKYEVCDLAPDMHFEIKKKMINYISINSKTLNTIAVFNYKKDMILMKQLWGYDFAEKIEKQNVLFNVINNKRNIFYVKTVEYFLRKLNLLLLK
jgi:glycosyltransferase involved in cell wall biosynthesis